MKTHTSLGLKLTTVISFFFLLIVSSQVRAITLGEAATYASNFGSGFGELIDIWKAPPDDNPDSVAAHLVGTTWELSQDEYLVNVNRDLGVFMYDLSFPDPYDPYYSEFFTIDNYTAEVGLWSFHDYTYGSAPVDILAVMSLGYVALFGYDPSARDGGWTNAAITGVMGPGVMSPDELKSQLEHHHSTFIAGYSVVPLPAAAPLFASALAVFGFITHRRRKNSSSRAQ